MVLGNLLETLNNVELAALLHWNSHLFQVLTDACFHCVFNELEVSNLLHYLASCSI